MRNIYLVLTMIFFYHQGMAQESFSNEYQYRAEYELTYQPDSTDVNSTKSEAMVLYLGNKSSRFSSLGTAVGDSLMVNRDRSNKSKAAWARLRAQIPETEFDYYIYKNVPEGKIFYTRKLIKDNFLYVEDSDLFTWKIYPDTKVVAGYQAQKATMTFAGRDYIAWFTSEIPIPDGPYKFTGLPGLIIKLRDQKGHYSFVLTEFKEIEPFSFSFTTEEYIITDKTKYENVVEEYNNDPFAAMERQGMSFGFKPGQREKLLKEHNKKLKNENNPLELE